MNSHFFVIPLKLAFARASRSNTVRGLVSIDSDLSTKRSSSELSENEPYGRELPWTSPECTGSFLLNPPSFFRGGRCDVVVQCVNPSLLPCVLYRGAHGSAFNGWVDGKKKGERVGVGQSCSSTR